MRIQKLNGGKVAVLTPSEIMRIRVINILSIKIQKLEARLAEPGVIQEARKELEDVEVYFNDKVRKQNRRAFKARK
jgi:hypothetical protein